MPVPKAQSMRKLNTMYGSVFLFFIAFVAYLMSYAKLSISLKIKSLKHNNAQRKSKKHWKIGKTVVYLQKISFTSA